MPRHPRLFLPDTIYHVYCRVARGEFVFDEDFEAMELVESLREVRNLDGFSILAWCLMQTQTEHPGCGHRWVHPRSLSVSRSRWP